jgi:hypothetical protein
MFLDMTTVFELVAVVSGPGPQILTRLPPHAPVLKLNFGL